MRSSKYRHIYGSPAKKEQCYEGMRITKDAHDSSFCAVNPKFLAIVLESAGGGVFLVVPLMQVNWHHLCCVYFNKWSENFDERPHRRRIFLLGKFIVTVDCFCGHLECGKIPTSSPQKCPFWIWTPSNTYFLGPT